MQVRTGDKLSIVALIYLISVLGTLRIISIVVAGISFVVSALMAVATIDLLEDKKMCKLIKKFLVCGAISLFFVALIPNKQDIAAMAVIPTIVNNEKVQNITGNGLSILEELTKKWLEELKDNSEKI